MPYLYDLPNATSGFDAIVLQMTQGSFSFIVPMILFFVFIVVFLGGITRQKTRIGTADYGAWAMMASISTLLIALLFSITAGYISADVLILVVSLTIGSGIWFFLDRRASEI